MSNEHHISQLVPALQPLVRQWIERARAEGFAPVIYFSYRSPEEQAQLYANGRGAYTYNGTTYIAKSSTIVTYAKPGESKHNTRRAFDFYDGNKVRDGKVQWSEVNWTRLGELGEACGLTWGGRWTKLVDRPHFEYDGPEQVLAAVNAPEEKPMALTPEQVRELYRSVLQREPENETVTQNRGYVEFMNGAVSELHARLAAAEEKAQQLDKISALLKEIIT